MATEDLGKMEVKLDRQFDVVTCMFAIHYFFASKAALDNFFRNVSINLKKGRSCDVWLCLTSHVWGVGDGAHQFIQAPTAIASLRHLQELPVKYPYPFSWCCEVPWKP